MMLMIKSIVQCYTAIYIIREQENEHKVDYNDAVNYNVTVSLIMGANFSKKKKWTENENTCAFATGNWMNS